MDTKPAITVTFEGKEFDANKLEDVLVLQRRLVPDNWPIAKREGVKLFLAHRGELAHELGRHLTKNFSSILKTALDEKEDGGTPEVAISFGFTLNFSALQVAARGKSKFSFKRNFSSVGKPVAQDLNQMDLFKDDLSASLDTDALIADEEPPKETQTETPAATDPTETPAPVIDIKIGKGAKGDKPKRGRGRPKKTVAKGDKSSAS